MFFSFKKIRSVVILLLAIPILVLLFYKSIILNVVVTEAYKSNAVERLAKLSVIQSDVVHQLQKERGLTAGFLKSNGVLFINELITQRISTDESVIKMNSFFNTFDPSDFDTAFHRNLIDSRFMVADVAQRRVKIDSLIANPTDVADYYTNNISTMIRNVNYIIEYTNIDEKLYRNLSAYYNLLEYKERLARIRAVLTGVFTQNILTKSDYAPLMNAITEKEIFSNQFLFFADWQTKRYYLEKFDSKEIQLTDNMINNTISLSLGDSTLYNSSIWFDNMTGRIDLMKDVEDYLAHFIITSSEAIQSEAAFKYWFEIISTIFGFLTTFLIAFFITKNLSDNLKKAKDAAEEIANGNLNVDLDSDRQDEIGELFISMQKMSSNISNLLSDTQILISAVKEGDLNQRGDLDKYNNSWEAMLNNINELIESFVKPIRVTSDYLDQISRGSIPKKIEEEYKGDFNQIKNNLNKAIDVMNGLIYEISFMIQSAEMGELSKRADETKFEGSWAQLVGGVNNLTDCIVNPLKVISNNLKELSQGNIPEKSKLDYNGDFAIFMQSLDLLIENLLFFIEQMKLMSSEHKAGNISFAMNYGNMKGTFQEMAEGVNNMVAANVDDTKMAIGIAGKYGKGDFSVDCIELPGEKAVIKSNLDELKKNLLSINAEVINLGYNVAEGRLNIRADVNKYDGGWKEMVGGINQILDSCTKPIYLTADYLNNISNGIVPNKIEDEYKGDFNQIKQSINLLIDTLNLFIYEMNNMSQSQNEGDIDVFMDEDKFQGAYLQMAAGVNQQVKSHISAVIELITLVNQLGNGNFDANVSQFKGKKVVLNQAVDSIKNKLKSLSSEIYDLIEAAQLGNLDARGKEEAFDGDWKKIVSGLNELINGIVSPIEESGLVLESLSNSDFTVEVNGEYSGEFDKLKNNINNLIGSLLHIFAEFELSINSASIMANRLASSAESMATASQEQSAQTDDIAQAIEQMSRAIFENAAAAQHTAEMAQENGEIATQGGLIVQQTTEKMKDIANVVKESAINIEKLGTSGDKIGEIISVIEDIADQTNLLALNAAIEAARAGEQGRGFAVVADEVRKLAERTTVATKEISGMIKLIQDDTKSAVFAMQKGNAEVQKGISLADDAGKALQQIVVSSNSLLNLVNQIANANESQSATSEQISKNIASISEVSNEAVQRIEEVAVAAEELKNVNVNLGDIMKRLKIDNSRSNRNLSSGANRKLLN